ncbi:hypothetical protein ACHAXR_005988, partial [Thalassiosira sp. AJA248-18]
MIGYRSFSGACLCLAVIATLPYSCSHRLGPGFINHMISLKTRSFDITKALPTAAKGNDETTLLFDAEEAAAFDAHDISDPGIEGAAMERAVIMAEEKKGQAIKKEKQHEPKHSWIGRIRSLIHHEDTNDNESDDDLDDQDLLDAKEAAVAYARGLSDVAAVEHAIMTANYDDKSSVLPKKREEDYVASVEEHYKLMEKDIEKIEHLIEEADRADRSEGHSLERTFSDDDAADLALMMMEKSVLAATDKLELCQKKTEQTENEVKSALEEKYSAKALAESIERDRKAAELRILSTEHFGEDADVLERRRDSSILHADSEIISDALKREHDAELKLEKAIEHDIAAKRELEQMIDNKAVLKQEFHELEKIIHERALSLWKKESSKKSKSKETKEVHHFDWWHRR